MFRSFTHYDEGTLSLLTCEDVAIAVLAHISLKNAAPSWKEKPFRNEEERFFGDHVPQSGLLLADK